MAENIRSKTLWRLSGFLRPHLFQITLAGLIVTACSLLGLLSPWPLKIIIDSVLGDQPLPWMLETAVGSLRDEPTILLLCTVLAGLALISVQRLLELANVRSQTRLSSLLQLELRSDLFQHAQRLSLSFHRQSKVGDILNRISYQALAIGQVALAFLPLTQSAVTLVGMFWVAYLLDAELALLSLAVVPFLYLSVGYYTRRIEPQVRQVRQEEGDILSILSESLSLLPVTLAFGRESTQYQRFRERSQSALKSRLDLTMRQSLFSLGVGLIAAVGTALVVGVGALHVLSGELTVGLLLVVITYVGSVYTPLQQISGTVGSLRERLVDLCMAFELLEVRPEIQDVPGAVNLETCRGHLQFDNVEFSYQGRKAILKDVSFEVLPGQFVGVIGPTGAGKTTLVSLIPRFYVPQSGRIRLDGQEIGQIKLRSLRRQISLVTQEPLLSSGTVIDNIRFGKPGASFEEVIDAAKSARIHDFIENLPDGYESETGELSSRLSTGERQRITIARAFLKNARILILDEPTSALDVRTELEIMDALRRLMVGRTTFMISHRLSLVSAADLILVMDQGRIVESGSHGELIKSQTLYRQLQKSAGGRAS